MREGLQHLDCIVIVIVMLLDQNKWTAQYTVYEG